MSLFDQFPYTNFHELNLDWLLRMLKELNSKVENFVALNTIKYADPIQWNITTQYEANTVVVDPQSGTAYISTKAVPSGVAISNTYYWSVIFTLDIISANKNITLRDDGSNVLATFASAAGDWLLWNGTLYKVSQAININEAYVAGYNLTRYTVEMFINDAIQNVINIIGNLDDLNTTDKDNIVKAINSLLLDINNIIGNLDDLNTTDKDNIVEAINSVLTYVDNTSVIGYPEEFGAVGDGVTDDTSAFQAAINARKIIYLNNAKTYLISTVTVPKGHSIIGVGTIKLSDDSTNGIILSGTNIIDGITFTDNLSNFERAHCVVYADNAENLTVKNCTFTDIHLAYCIRFDRSEKITINNNHISDYCYTGIMLVNGCYDAAIERNYIYNARNPITSNCYPISISGYEADFRDVAKRIKCNYNHIVELNPVWEGIDSHGVIDCEIAFNKIEGVRSGIAMGAGPTSGRDGAIPSSNKNLFIHHNEITFDNGTTYGSGITVVETLKNAEHKMENVVIDSNIIKSLHTAMAHTVLTSMIGVSTVSSDCNNLKITNNILSGTNDGISVDSYTSGRVGKIEIIGNDISGGNADDYMAISFSYMNMPFDIIDVCNNTIHNITRGVSVRSFITNSGTSMINYHNNKDNGLYNYADFITTPKPAFNVTTARGKLGDFIPSTANDNKAGWFCKSAGHWIAI